MHRLSCLLAAVLCVPGAAALAQDALPDVRRPVQGQATEGSASHYAVVIGNGRYANIGRPLPSAEADAQALSDAFHHALQIPRDRIDAGNLHVGVREMTAALTRAGEATGPGDIVWVYYTGYGAAHPTSGDRMFLADEVRAATSGVDVADYGLPLPDARRLATAGGAKVIFIVDADYSGLGRDGEPITEGPHIMRVANQTPSVGTVQWSAASAGAWATDLPGTSHGAFSYLLLGALRGWADGVGGERDGRVTLAEAHAYIGEALGELGVPRQQPELLHRGDVDPDEITLVTLPDENAEPRPKLPRVVRTAKARAPSDEVDLDDLLQQQACDDQALGLATAAAKSKLEAARQRVFEEARQAWADQSPGWEQCLQSPEDSAREACGASVESFVRAIEGATARVSAGKEVVATDCGPRTRIVAAREAPVGFPQLREAQALLRRLRGLPGAEPTRPGSAPVESEPPPAPPLPPINPAPRRNAWIAGGTLTAVGLGAGLSTYAVARGPAVPPSGSLGARGLVAGNVAGFGVLTAGAVTAVVGEIVYQVQRKKRRGPKR